VVVSVAATAGVGGLWQEIVVAELGGNAECSDDAVGYARDDLVDEQPLGDPLA